MRVIFVFLLTLNFIGNLEAFQTPTSPQQKHTLLYSRIFMDAAVIKHPLSNSWTSDSFFMPSYEKKHLPSQQISSIKQWWNQGSNVHITSLVVNAVLFLGLLLGSSSRSIHSLYKFTLWNNYLGQFADNIIKAAGKTVGEGIVLRRLNKLSLVLHGLNVPLAALPITEIAGKHGLFQAEDKYMLCLAW
eukprot:CAMPEP_0185728436 /NCGR_PEP_ID=MMETSP1171-20130828/3770_1 /TAXON_ID=374046 /ORGANISM="Helicotheca tamensis, Strain CCMP826" /LENGTH=187 /DNA_ID=CAMNT_0028397149 /DNA_START=124 /DNA_END=684 /DNA_ORIENTATION=+